MKMLNKIEKVIMCWILSLGMTCMSSLTIMAQGRVKDDISVSTNDNIGYYFVIDSSYGKWMNSEEVKCEHKNFGTDMIQKRIAYRTYKYSLSGRAFETTIYQTQTICHGYDN